METQNEVPTPHSVITGMPASNTSRSKALDLANSLIQAPGDDADSLVDQMVTLPVTKPNKAQFFRVHPTLYQDVNLLKVDTGGHSEFYAVVPGMVKSLDGVHLYTMFFGVQRDGAHFLWPINAYSNDGWSTSARQIAIAAMEQWCRITPSATRPHYEKRVRPSYVEVPNWPEDKTFGELLALAFGDGHIIDTLEHPMAKDMSSL